MIPAATIADLAAVRPTSARPTDQEVEQLRESLASELRSVTQAWHRPAAFLGITKSRIAAVRRCPASVVAETANRTLSEPLVVGALVDQAAALRMMSDRLPGKAPWLDSILPSIEVVSPDIAAYVHRLSPEARDLLRTAVQRKGELLEQHLGDLRDTAVSAQERFRVQFSTAGVQLSGRTDLVLGRHERVICEIKAGRYRPEFHTEMSFYALLAALRDRTAPVAVATLTLDDATGVAAHEVTIDMLEAAAAHVVDTATALVDIDEATEAGSWPTTQPGPLCRWCGVASRCPNADPDAMGAAADASVEPEFVDEDEDEPW